MLIGCAGTSKSSRPYAEPKVDDIVARLAKARGELTSFRADSTMDYWLGTQRAKGEVLVMGTVGAKVRFAALSPAGGSSMAEMACDGSNFVYIDYQNNCAISGPCDQRSIAQFFHIELAPDDFLHLALGTPPVIDQPTGDVAWDAGRGLYQVQLAGRDGKQTIGIADRDQRWEVVESALVGPDGTPEWQVKNADFGEAKDAAGVEHRVPGKSRFITPNNQKADLTVEWHDDRTINVAIDPQKFTITVPAGLPTCGARPAK
jgi:hypothetical protein